MNNDIEIRKEELRNNILKSVELGYEKVNELNSITELNRARFKEKYSYYRNKIFDEFTEDALNKMKVELEFVETKEQYDLWKYLKMHTSSIQTNESVGRRFQILVKDRTTNKYIGLLKIGDDVLLMNARDRYIGWKDTNGDGNYYQTMTNDEMTNKLKYVLNAKCCVGLQPASYNFHIGKLLISLCFSREVQDYFYKKYDNYIAGILTTSINGKSVQYSRLDCVKLIGFTYGKAPYILNEVYRECVEFMKNDLGIDMARYDRESSSKIKKCRRILQELDLKTTILENQKIRGVYFGYTTNESKKFLKDANITNFNPNINDFQTVEQIADWWKKRWAENRIKTLIATNKVRTAIELSGMNRDEKQTEYSRSYKDRAKQVFGDDYYDSNNNNARLNYQKRKLNFNKEYNPKKYPDIDIEKEYVAGLFDTIGNLTIFKYDDKYQLTIYLEHSNKVLMSVLKKKYGGNIYIKNNGYIYILTDKKAKVLLDDIINHVVIKIELIMLLIKCYEMNDETIYKNVIEINDKNDHKLINYNRFNDKYISALYDCKALIDIAAKYKGRYNYFGIRIKGFNDSFNDELIKYLNHANKAKDYVIITSEKILELLININKYSIIKKNINDILIDYINDIRKNKRTYNDDIHKYRQELYNKFITL